MNCNSFLYLFKIKFAQISVATTLPHNSGRVLLCVIDGFEKSSSASRHHLVAEDYFEFLSFSRHPITKSTEPAAAASYYHESAYSSEPSPNLRATESLPSVLPLTYSSK